MRVEDRPNSWEFIVREDFRAAKQDGATYPVFRNAARTIVVVESWEEVLRVASEMEWDRRRSSGCWGRWHGFPEAERVGLPGEPDVGLPTGQGCYELRDGAWAIVGPNVRNAVEKPVGWSP